MTTEWSHVSNQEYHSEPCDPRGVECQTTTIRLLRKINITKITSDPSGIRHKYELNQM